MIASWQTLTTDRITYTVIPLFIYKDTHLRRQFTKAYNYKNKGVDEQRKKSGLLQCQEVTRYYVERVVCYDVVCNDQELRVSKI